jgi:hypothetical protein
VLEMGVTWAKSLNRSRLVYNEKLSDCSEGLPLAGILASIRVWAIGTARY